MPRHFGNPVQENIIVRISESDDVRQDQSLNPFRKENFGNKQFSSPETMLFNSPLNKLQQHNAKSSYSK